MKFMSKRNLMQVFAVLMLTFSLLACKKDDDPAPGGREVKFELTGNVVGTIALVYPDANGAQKSEIITSLPWSKTLTYESSVNTVYFSCSGNGTNGQTATLKVYVGGKEKSSNSSTITNIFFSVNAPTFSL